MSLDDIADTIKAYRSNREELSRERLSEQACMTYVNACFSAIAVYNPKKFPKNLQDAFPKLFGDEKPVQQDWREMKAYIQSFSKQRKKQRKENNKF